MNVWLWGPSLWDIFHGSAYMADHETGLRKPLNVMAHSLRAILPCIYCKNSYNQFLDELGMPGDGLALEWSHRLHNKVNEKLEVQRIDKLQQILSDVPESVWDTLKKPSSRHVLFNVPSLEVVTKRCILNGDNPWTEMDVLKILAVLNMHAMGQDEAKVPDDVAKALSNFTSSLVEMHCILGVPQEYLKFLKSLLSMPISERIAVLGRRMYPGHSAKDIQERLRLFRAGACLNGTCS